MILTSLVKKSSKLAVINIVAFPDKAVSKTC
jgi:hypothetical protein